MPARTEWLVENQVIYSQFIGDITHEDAMEFIDTLKTLIDSKKGEHRIHFIQDVRYIGKPYMNMQVLKGLFNDTRRMQGWYVVLRKPSNRLFGMVASIAGQMLRIRMRPPFDDYASLRKFLSEQDSDLALPAELPALFTAEEIDVLQNQAVSEK